MNRCVFVFFFLFLLATISVAQTKTDLILGISIEPPHLDPTAGSSSIIDEIVYTNIFEGLTRIDQNGTVVPALAKSWEIQDQGKSFVFYLNNQVRFHNGKMFNAYDVEYSLNRARDPKSINPQKNLFQTIKNIEIIDPFTIKINLTYPQKEFLWNLGLGDAIIVEKESSHHNKNHPIGTGSFQFLSWEKGSSITMVKNKLWYGKPVHLEKIEFRIMPDPIISLAALFSGKIDAFPSFPLPEAEEQIKKQGTFSFFVGTTSGETILAINHRKEILKNLNIRKAIAHAIDRTSIIEGTTFGLAKPIGSHCLPKEEMCQKLTNTFIYDIEKAKFLIQNSGFKEIRFSLVLPPSLYARRSGEMIAMQLQQVGIKVDIIPIQWSHWLEKVFKHHDFDLTIISHTEPKDMEIYTKENYYFGYKNIVYNRFFEESQKETDPFKEKTLIEKAQTILAQDVAAVFLFSLPKIGVWHKNLKGFSVNAPIPNNDLTNVQWHE